MSFRFIESYVHGNKIGVLVELETVDDFATRTDEFRDLARDIAIQIAASDPTSIDGQGLDDAASNLDRTGSAENTLISQPFVKEPDRTVADRIKDVEDQLCVRIRVVRFVRFAAGDT